MISGLLKKIFGSRNDRLIKQYSAVVRRINALEGEIAALSDDALRAKTDEFRNRLMYILEDARAIEKKDAAVNALNIIFSLNTMSAEYLREYYREFLANIRNIHLGYEERLPVGGLLHTMPPRPRD